MSNDKRNSAMVAMEWAVGLTLLAVSGWVAVTSEDVMQDMAFAGILVSAIIIGHAAVGK